MKEEEEKIEKQVMQLSIFTASSIAHMLTKTKKKKAKYSPSLSRFCGVSAVLLLSGKFIIFFNESIRNICSLVG